MHTRKLILEAAGHTVVTAQSEAEIVAACREHQFDVAVIGQASQPTLKLDWFTKIHKACPSAKILEVYLPSEGISLPNADAWVESPVVPTDLAERIAALAAMSNERRRAG
jgi:DNA-binding NtrC family response regulator